LNPQADVWVEDLRHYSSGIDFKVVSDRWEVPARCNLIGLFNISNCLAAITAVVCGLGIDPADAARGLANFEGIPGRMERIDLGQDFTAIVDFAHTPNALKNALKTAGQITDGQVIVIFGSAGLRDKEKRRLMAEASADLADISILTAEDPRTESLEDILEEMAQGAKSRGGVEGKTFWRVPDRGEAIRKGLLLANPGDIVLSCGKGHEQSMCFGEIEYPWDDRTAMKAALSEYLGINGPQMPFLPTQK
jgi:UDP-N-acetylmuramoyl-L-alanyl-D-glutamate--2,6-diaminopimelate ligase